MENYVDRKEFDALKNEVEEIKTKTDKNAELLHQIDKKIDSISVELKNINQTEDLKLSPLKDRVTNIENSNTWLWRAIAGAIITIVVKIIFDISH